MEFKSITHNFRFSLQDGLLHAIKEEYVEAVEILLEWEEKTHKPGQAYVNSIQAYFFLFRLYIFFISYLFLYNLWNILRIEQFGNNINVLSKERIWKVTKEISISIPLIFSQSWEAVDKSSSNFTPDITPLILAAHKNNYEILKILLDRGATLPTPHDARYKSKFNFVLTSNRYFNISWMINSWET